jgi:hypothetical protein
MHKRLNFELLESRLALIAEGTGVAIDIQLDTTGVVGNISAVSDWGDNTQTGVSVSNGPARGPLTARFDYTYDTTGFFNVPERRQILQAAADIVFAKFSDQLTAIAPSGTNTWTAKFPNPATGQEVTVSNPSIAANELLIFVGARDLPGSEVALGGGGGFDSRGATAWLQNVRGRGQPGAISGANTDFGPWGGSVAVDPTVKWHFGPTTNGLDADEYDFLTAVSHELMHVLGFGIVQSYLRYVSGGAFNGPTAAASFGGVVPLSGDGVHWREGTQSSNQEALMDPTINGPGFRKLPTPLDVAALVDIGWNLIPQTVRVVGSHTYGDNGFFPTKVTLIGSQAGSRTFTLLNTSVENVAPALSQIPDQTARVGLPFSLTNLRVGTFQDQGFGPSETFQVTIDWGDGSPIERLGTTIDQNGSPGVPTRGSFGGEHTFSQPGTYRVTCRVEDDDGGFDQKSFNIVVLGQPTLRLTADRASIFEDGGDGAAFLTLNVEGLDPSQATTIDLVGNDPSEAVVPASVIVPAGSSQVSIPIAARDDRILDGSQMVEFVAKYAGVTSEPVRIEVLDRERFSVNLIADTVREDAGPGASVLRIARSDQDSTNAVVVQITSGSVAAATVPASVSIPAGASFFDVSVTAVDNRTVDGSRTTVITVQAGGYESGSAALTVLDYEPIQWVPQAIQLNEAADMGGKPVEIRLPSAAGPNGVTVGLSVDLPNQLNVPAQVIVPAGQDRVSFQISTINDSIVESPKSPVITATAAGYESAKLNVLLSDDDRSLWTNSANNFDVDSSGTVEAIDILLVINYIRRAGGTITLPTTRDPIGPPYVDVNGDGTLEALDILLVINQLRRLQN